MVKSNIETKPSICVSDWLLYERSKVDEIAVRHSETCRCQDFRLRLLAASVSDQFLSNSCSTARKSSQAKYRTKGIFDNCLRTQKPLCYSHVTVAVDESIFWLDSTILIGSTRTLAINLLLRVLTPQACGI